MKVFSHDEEYFNKTPIEKQRVCCNCLKRDAKKDRCNEDNHYVGYVECFTQWCRHWATDKALWESEVEE